MGPSTLRGPSPAAGAVVPPPAIVTAGLVVHLDAGDPASYGGTGVTWTDLETATAFTLQAIFPAGAPTEPFFNGAVGYFNFYANNAAGTFGPAINPTRGAVEIWFRWRTSSALTATVLITGAGANWVSLGNATGSLPDESLELNTGVAAVMDDKQGHTYYRDGEWHQMVAVIDGAANVLYVDGLAVTTTFRGGAVNSTGLSNYAATIIGKYTSGYQFDGDIAIVRVYDTAAFSAADVAQNYTANSGRFAVFQPDSIAGLKLWLDPSDANSVTTTGADIEEVRDKAWAIAYVAADSIGASDVTLTTVDAMQWMTFDGVNQYMQMKSSGSALPLSSVLGTQASGWEMHAVLAADTATGTDVANPYSNNNIIMDAGGYWGIACAVDPGDGANVRVQPNAYDGSSHWTDYDIPKDEAHVFGVSYAGGGSTDMITYIDGATTTVAGVGADNIPNAMGGALQLGLAYGTEWYKGRIGEVCIFAAPLTPTERAALLAYLKAKWGTP